MRKEFRATMAFVCGCVFTVVMLTRCGVPGGVSGVLDGGIGMLRDAGLLPDGGMIQDAGATTPGGIGQTLTASCDHTATSGASTSAFAVFSGVSFDTSHPGQLLAITCGLKSGTGSPLVSYASSQQTPSGWLPTAGSDSCVSAVPSVIAGNVYVNCGNNAFGIFQTATLTVIPTN